jgi:spore germination protein GerM
VAYPKKTKFLLCRLNLNNLKKGIFLITVSVLVIIILFEFAALVFKNENPNNLDVKIYFGNTVFDPENSCNKVFFANRSIVKTQAVAKATLEELLKGPSVAEKKQGYFSSIPQGSKLNSIKIENGTAYADFNELTESGGGSCSMAERISEINSTLKQFSSVKNVVISINGRMGDIFQP